MPDRPDWLTELITHLGEPAAEVGTPVKLVHDNRQLRRRTWAWVLGDTGTKRNAGVHIDQYGSETRTYVWCGTVNIDYSRRDEPTADQMRTLLQLVGLRNVALPRDGGAS